MWVKGKRDQADRTFLFWFSFARHVTWEMPLLQLEV
jgi:hypothetical protein